MRLAFLILYGFFMPLLQAQDLTGCWEGTLWQGTGETAEAFHFEICLEKEGDFYKGYSLIEWKALFARYQLRGAFSDEAIYLREITVLSERREDKMDWCTKELRLKYSRSSKGEQLRGSWQGHSDVYGSCEPGHLRLVRRKKDRA